MLQWAIPNFSIINSFTIIMQSYADESTIVLWHRWCLIKVSMKQVQNKIKLNQVYSHVSLGYRSISALASTGRSGHCHHLVLLFHPPSSSRLLFLFLRKITNARMFLFGESNAPLPAHLLYTSDSKCHITEVHNLFGRMATAYYF